MRVNFVGYFVKFVKVVSAMSGYVTFIFILGDDKKEIGKNDRNLCPERYVKRVAT